MTSAAHAGPPPSANEQELLQRLIAEGLALSDQEDDFHPHKYRQLIEVLVQACILGPLKKADVAPRLEQAQYTLRILEKQVRAHPELLLAPPAAGEATSPLYKWLVPRLIYAAARYRLINDAASLSQEIIRSLSLVMQALALDHSDEESKFALGMHRARSCLLAIAAWIRGNLDGSQGAKLYDYEGLSGSEPELLLACQVCLSAPQPLGDMALLPAAGIFSTLSQPSRARTPSEEIILIQLSTAAVANHGHDALLDQALLKVVSLPRSADIEWQRAMSAFLLASSHASPSLRSNIWWLLLPSADALDVSIPLDAQIAITLVQPITGHLTSENISSAISVALLQKWSKISSEVSVAVQQTLRPKDAAAEERTSLKRKRDDVADIAVRSHLADKHPGLQIPEGHDVMAAIASIEKDPATSAITMDDLQTLVCLSSGCVDHRPPYTSRVRPSALEVWLHLQTKMTKNSQVVQSSVAFDVLLVILNHIGDEQLAAMTQSKGARQIIKHISAGMASNVRAVRLAASRAISAFFVAQISHPNAVVGKASRKRIIKDLEPLLTGPLPVRSTAILTLGHLGREANGEERGMILEALVAQLRTSNHPIKALAYSELTALSRCHGPSPWGLLHPYLDRISVLVTSSMVTDPEFFGEVLHLIGFPRQLFVETTIRFTVPQMVIARNRPVLDQIAAIMGKSLGIILLDNIANILATAFLHPSSREETLIYIVDLLEDLVKSPTSMHFTVADLMKTCIVPFVFILIVELGDEDERKASTGMNALRRAQQAHSKSNAAGADLGPFLKPHMLGIISHLNDTLQDAQGKATFDYKRKVIRSLAKLIEHIGDSMSSFSPQIVASLQSTLGIQELRTETLRAWRVFIQTLKYADVGPFVGRTIAALAANWKDFNDEQRKLAVDIASSIAGLESSLKPFLDEIVGVEDIPELAAATEKLWQNRRSKDAATLIDGLLERIRSKNNAVAVVSLRELRAVLVNRTHDIHDLTEGDVFDPIVSRLVRALLSCATADSEESAIRELSYECLGILGAVDPDRLVPLPEQSSMTIMHNFADPDESSEFAIHLIRDLLVDAFRATNDTKHQNHLAFAIQELLRFSDLTPKVLHGSTVPLKVRARWESLPKDQHETLTPLLESRFALSDKSLRTFEHPIYASAPTYREWLQNWSADLIGRVLAREGSDRATVDSKAIFGVLRGVLRNQDVTAAHHILPHLVLNVLLSGIDEARDEICLEINTVLQAQVNADGASDKRTLSAQVVFDLMDHLSKWLRLSRGEHARNKEVKIVDGVLNSIEMELLANAALQSRAFARSLRSFERRMINLTQTRPDVDIQLYWERLHEIYAELDEPDGMEGVSAFVISPSLEYQIREHESTGRWTSAQSCWEVRLQQSPEDLSYHIGLLKCLRNLGHYDTLRTHIRGVLSRHPEWAGDMSAFEAEAAWIIGDWDTVRNVSERGHAMASVMLDLHRKTDISTSVTLARRAIGEKIASKHYPRAYDSLMQLHILRDVELMDSTRERYLRQTGQINGSALQQEIKRDLLRGLDQRLNRSAPAFRHRETILSVRRTGLGALDIPAFASEVGQAWISSAKIARKAGYEQTAYSSVLQAKELDTPFAFIQQAKLLLMQGGPTLAARSLKHSLAPLALSVGKEPGTGPVKVGDASGKPYDKRDARFEKDHKLAKGSLLLARWLHEGARTAPNEVIAWFGRATNLSPNDESSYYHLGHYYDELHNQAMQQVKDSKDARDSKEKRERNLKLYQESANANLFTCLNYIRALQCGVKYIYRTMPRLLTIWLDLAEYVAGEHGLTDPKKSAVGKDLDPKVAAHLSVMNSVLKRIIGHVEEAQKELTEWQFLTAFPQIVSRIGHIHPESAAQIRRIMVAVVRKYPQQALWPLVGLIQSNRKDRKEACRRVLDRATNGPIKDGINIGPYVEDATKLSKTLLRLSDEKVDGKKTLASISQHFPFVKEGIPCRMIMPLQDALTCTLPSATDMVKTHNPFPNAPVTIAGIEDRVDIMPSLQRPKKIVFKGSDGKKYPFLCKPHDDLRKDARLMDLNAMINKLLKSTSDARRRQLYIRTYAVMPLNEECGLLEWVSNTKAMKSILEKEYARYGKKIYTADLHHTLEEARKKDRSQQIDVFQKKVLPLFQPTVFREWFLSAWPEPSAWLMARLSYNRTLAVMSMVGFVLGLGDRHGENILFDGLKGDTVHVDLNCLFDKGKSFEIPERVPFRLTQNLVDALGITGPEGVFRKAAETTMGLLRSNSESLMSVLEAFLHDPLVEFNKGTSRKGMDVRAMAKHNLDPIQWKLKGYTGEKDKNGAVQYSPVANQVDSLIEQARRPENLALMYQGWAPWL